MSIGFVWSDSNPSSFSGPISVPFTLYFICPAHPTRCLFCRPIDKFSLPSMHHISVENASPRCLGRRLVKQHSCHRLQLLWLANLASLAVDKLIDHQFDCLTNFAMIWILSKLKLMRDLNERSVLKIL